MTTSLVGDGPRSWSMTIDDKGQRTYIVKHLIACSALVGPFNAINTPGLPKQGDSWDFGQDSDEWATCTWDAKITPMVDKESNNYFEIEQKFQTESPNTKTCKDQPVQDPLLEPQEVSGSFTRYTEEATVDRFGKPIVNSAFEMIRGPQVEFDKNRSTVKIKQNVPLLEVEVFAPMVDTLNVAPLWGLPARTIKLSTPTWERKFHGQCNVYYSRTFEFEIRAEGWDRFVLDEGTKVLNGKWDPVTGDYRTTNIAGSPPNPNNPKHFIRFQDRQGNNCRVVLNGRGLPAGVIAGTGRAFLSVAASNIGHTLDDPLFWVPITLVNGSFTEPDLFDLEQAYIAGELVSVQVLNPGNPLQSTLSFYTCIGSDFVGGTDPPDDPTNWRLISVPPHTSVPKGSYSVGTTYNLMDTVIDLAGTSAGSIFVSKYGESDFLLLGIPTIL